MVSGADIVDLVLHFGNEMILRCYIGVPAVRQHVQGDFAAAIARLQMPLPGVLQLVLGCKTKAAYVRRLLGPAGRLLDTMLMLRGTVPQDVYRELYMALE
jgi:hypothetical protein